MDNRFIEKPLLNSPYGFPLVNANNDTIPELNRLALKLATGAGKTTVEICHLIPHVFVNNSPMKGDLDLYKSSRLVMRRFLAGVS